MTDTRKTESTPGGADTHREKDGDDHYQPWLRNGASGAGDRGVMRPGPLPTRGTTKGPGETPLVGIVRQGSELSAEELLARPIPMAPLPPEGPTIGERVAGELTEFFKWATMLGERADVPARVARLELGRRSRAAIGWLGQSARAGASNVSSATQAGIAAAAPKLDAAGKATLEALAKGASGANAGLGAGAAMVSKATRGLVDAAPMRGKARHTEPIIESQLDKLLADEPVVVTARPVRPAEALPLFAEPSPTSEPAPASIQLEAARLASQATPAPPPEPIGSGRVREGGNGMRTSGGGTTGGDGSDRRPWHRHPGTLALGGALLLAGGFAAGQYWTGPGVDRATTERVIHDYLLNNPEILPQAMQRLQATQAAATVNRLRTRIEQPFSGAWAGAADGDVTLTVFTDYACTFCRASVPDIDRLLREDRRLKVVFRELPILSPESEPAARLALAAARRGRYMPMHRALFQAGTPDADGRRAAAIALDVANDAAVLNDAAISRELDGNLTLARELGFDGTPSWVVGDRMLTGAVGYDQLRAAVAAAREG